MVRTYAFNPSTQSAGLPGTRKPPPELFQHQPHQVPPSQLKSALRQQIPPQQERVYEAFLQQPFDASLSMASSISSNGPSMPQIIPGSTQLFGIRSVIIDGQQFYQPIDPQLNQLINKEFASLGIINNNGNNGNNNNIRSRKDFSPSPPADPMHSNQNHIYASVQKQQKQNPNVGALAALHLATQPYYALSSNMSQSYSNNSELSSNNSQSLQRSDSLKAFSEFDPAIQKNQVGINPNHHSSHLSSFNRQTSNSSNEKNIMIDDELPWARGNPQPKSGKRGTLNWNAGQRISQVPSSIYSLNDPFTLSGKLFDSQLNRLHPAPPPPASLYHFDNNDPYSSLSSAPPLPVHLPSVNMSSNSNTYGSFYNNPSLSSPSLNATTGAPTRNSYYPTPAPMAAANTFHRMDFPKNDKEQHKLELLRQIEENKQRKEYEKMREREIEDRERLRSEIFQARQQAEMDEEKRATKEKALAAERKAARMAEATAYYSNSNNKTSNSNNYNNSRRDSRDSFSREPNPRRRQNTPPRNIQKPGSDDMSGPPRKLEWWEKKDHLKNEAAAPRQQSPAIPTLRNKNNPSSPPNEQPPSRQINQRPRAPSVESTTLRNRTPSVDQPRKSSALSQRRSSSQLPSRRNDSPRPGSRPIRPAANAMSRNSRLSIDSADIKPPRFDRANETMRSLDQTHRELEHEQRRVHKAIQENNYDHEVFQ